MSIKQKLISAIQPVFIYGTCIGILLFSAYQYVTNARHMDECATKLDEYLATTPAVQLHAQVVKCDKLYFQKDLTYVACAITLDTADGTKKTVVLGQETKTGECK